MARYRVTPQVGAGVYRAGVGFFRPGAEFEMPDEEIPHKALEPVDEAAQAALKRFHKIDKALAVDVPAPKKSVGLTVREAAQSAGVDAEPSKASEPKGKRAADK